MSRRLHAYTIGIALAAAAFLHQHAPEASDDPHKPRPRSKGEKARNRKFRGGA